MNVISPTLVIILWETDEASNGVVNYRPVDENGAGIGGFLFVPDQQPTRFHGVFVGGLTAGTDVDTDPPRFGTRLSVEATGTTEARVFFETDEPATTLIEYHIPDSFDVGIFRTFDDLNLEPLHDVILSGLTAGTRYKLQVSTTDGQNNGPTVSPVLEFFTPNVEDSQPPGFTSRPRPVVTDTDLVVIEWTTDEIATSAVTMQSQATTFLTPSGSAPKVVRRERFTRSRLPGWIRIHRIRTRSNQKTVRAIFALVPVYLILKQPMLWTTGRRVYRMVRAHSVHLLTGSLSFGEPMNRARVLSKSLPKQTSRMKRRGAVKRGRSWLTSTTWKSMDSPRTRPTATVSVR